jgi:hypothetical protein
VLRPASVSICRRAVLLGSVLFIATTVTAQPVSPTRQAAPSSARLLPDSLEARAERLSANTNGWLDAARLQRRAATLRGDDTSAVDAWSRAAWFYAGAGKLGPARQMLVHSAEHAVAGGDVERAVVAYLDAALIAAEDGRTDLVPGLLRRMRLVAASPLLATPRREQLLARAGTEPRLAQFAPVRTSVASSTSP